MSRASDDLRQQPSYSGTIVADDSVDAQHGTSTEPDHKAEAQPTSKHPPLSITRSDESLFHSTQPMPTAADDDDDDPDDLLPYPEAASEEQLLPPPDFKPFFMLIEDPITGEHYHPDVHYIFSDDENDALTPAALNAIEAGDVSAQESEERIVIIDMAADGKSVVKADSLSPNWQAIKTTTRQAPSWGGDAGDADRGLMLKISGQEVTASQKKRVRQAGSVEEMVRSFGERLHILDEVLSGKDMDEDEETTRATRQHAESLEDA